MPGIPMKKTALAHLCLVFVLPFTVNGQHLLTVAAVVSGHANNTHILGRSEFTLGNSTNPNVAVIWTEINAHHPFQISQHLAELADKQVDLVLLPDHVHQAVKVRMGLNGKAPALVSYFRYDQEPEDDQSEQSSSIDPSSVQASEKQAEGQHCDGTEEKLTATAALVAVIQQLEWRRLIVLSEHSYETLAQDLSDSLEKTADRIQLLQYSVRMAADSGGETNGSSDGQSGQSIKDVVQSLYDRRDEELKMVLLCSVDCVIHILTTASNFDHENDKKTAMALISRWLLILPPRHQNLLESRNLELDNVAVIVHPPATQRLRVKDLREELEKILQTAHARMLSNNITLSAQSLSAAIRQSFELTGSCERSLVRTLLWKPEGRRLSDVGFVGPDRRTHLCDGQEVFPNIMFGLNKRKFIVATLPWPSFVERAGNGSYRGMCVDLLHQLQQSLNFSYEWTEPEDQLWGKLADNGSWTGLVDMLAKKKVDMVMAPITVQADRETVMDFTHPFYIDYTTVLIKLPDPAESKWKRLIQPFQTEVHLYIWISLLGVTVITFTMEFVNPFYLTNTKAMLHLGDMFWYMFGALLTQGGARLPDSQTGRTMVSAFWLFSIVMAAIYSGNLIAFLTVSKDKAPFDTLKGMVEQDRYKWGTLGGSFFITLFETAAAASIPKSKVIEDRLLFLQKSSLPVFKKIWQGLDQERHTDPDVISSDPIKHLDKVKAGYYGYIGDKSAITTWLKTECDLITIKEDFLPMQYAMGLINNSAYTRMFSDQIMEINEIGLTETLIRKWWSKTSFCTGSLTASSTPIELIDVQSAFYLVFIGITLALLILLLEKTSHHFHVVSRLQQALCRKKDGSAYSSSSSGDMHTAFSSNIIMRRVSQSNVHDRPLGNELRHVGLFQLGTQHLNRVIGGNERNNVVDSPARDNRLERGTYFTYGSRGLHRNGGKQVRTTMANGDDKVTVKSADEDQQAGNGHDVTTTPTSKIANGVPKTKRTRQYQDPTQLWLN